MSNSPWTDFPDRSAGSQNPYAPTDFTTNLPMASSSDIETRNKYLNHEASIQGIGTLYLLGGVLGIIGGIIAFGGGVVSIAAGQPDASFPLIFGMIFLAISLAQLWVAIGLRKLNPKVRTAAILFSVLGLLYIPIGTLISAYFLYLLASKKGEYVFSEEYARVRDATPEIKYRTSKLVWGLLIALILLIFLGILAAVLGA